ncbi:MAG: hypothetical protein ACI30D_05550 [Muribaculaceae bacterium]
MVKIFGEKEMFDLLLFLQFLFLVVGAIAWAAALNSSGMPSRFCVRLPRGV